MMAAGSLPGVEKSALKNSPSAHLGVLAMLGRARAYWRPYKGLGAALVVLLLLQQAFTTGLAVSLKLIIDNVLAGTNDPPLWLILVGLTVGYALAAGASLAGDLLESKATAAITNDVRRHLFQHLQRLGMDFYTRMPLGDILARFSSDLGVLRQGLTRRMVEGVLSVLGLLVNLPVLFYLEWRLALLTTVAVPLMVLTVGRMTPRAADATYVMKKAEGDVLNAVQENVRAQPVIKAFGLHTLAMQRFHEEIDALAQTSIRSGFLISLVGTASALGVQSVQLLITGIGAWMAFRGDMTAGSLVAFLSLLTVVSKHTYDISKRVVPALIRASSGVRLIEELLNAPVRVSDGADAARLPPLSGAVRFDTVRFGYDETPVLKGLDLEIPAGQTVAVVGASGSGKSTVLNLLLRFYDVDGGAVRLDGTDVREGTLDSLRGQMGVVFQDNFLFNTSLRENIRMARLDATDAEVEEAARRAEIDALIQRLPEGYDTLAGEGGTRLSGGQRQRVAIARALLRDPVVLLLDEATSALDPATESAINDTLMRVAAGRTVISVTHRLASAVGFDRIVVVDEGRVVEQGTHAELLAKGGQYARLWAKQDGFQVSADGRRARVDAERLAAIPIFSVLDQATVDAMVPRFVSEVFAADDVVFEEGDAGDRFYVVVRGKVEVVVGGQVVAHLEDGDIFGEMALLDDTTRNATIRARTQTLTISLGREDFHELLDASPQMMSEVEAVAGRRRTSPG